MNPSPEQRLQALIDKAPRQLTPAQPLWDKIEKRLDVPQPSKNHHWHQWAIACSLLLALLFSYRFWLPETKEMTELAESPSQALAQDDLQTLLSQIDAEHKRQVSALEIQAHSVSWKHSQYGTPLEAGLRELREAAQQIYRSLQTNPTDKHLWEIWLWVQKRELELLLQKQKLPQETDIQTI
jgi:hypothetical protein